MAVFVIGSWALLALVAIYFIRLVKRVGFFDFVLALIGVAIVAFVIMVITH